MVSLTNTSPFLVGANRALNPFWSDPAAKVGLSASRRMLRAVLISARNGALLFALVRFAALLIRVVPGPLILLAGVTLGASIYAWIRRCDARGRPAGPIFTLALFAVVAGAVADARSLVDGSGFTTHYDHVIDADKFLFLGQVPSVWLQAHLYSPGSVHVLDVLCSLVYVSYFATPLVAAVVLWHLRPLELRLYVVAFLLVTCTGMIVFTVLPTAPPWLASNDGHIGKVTQVVPVLVDKVHPGTYDQGRDTVGVNEVAAFPSFHLAETVLVVFALTRLNPRLRRPGWAYAVAMGFSLIYLGEHYLTDVLAGAAWGAAGWALALRLTPLLFRYTSLETEVEPLPEALAA